MFSNLWVDMKKLVILNKSGKIGIRWCVCLFMLWIECLIERDYIIIVLINV